MIPVLIGFFALFFAPIIISIFVRDPNTNKKCMRIYTIVFISSFLWLPFLASIGTNNSSSEAVADGFTIEGYEVILDVGVDNRVSVTENIDINFYESGHHGIYKFTPDGKTVKRKSKVLNYRAEGDEYVLDVVKDKDRIKIGSASRTVYGTHRYVIKYDYDMGKDPYSGFDEFIFHAFGDFWGTEIKNPKIVVHMPKNINNYAVNAFTDKYRTTNINNSITKEIDGNTIIITNNSNIPILKSLIIDVELPEGYFEGGSWNYGWTSFTISAVIILLTIIVAIIWYKHGKDYEKKIPTVEFYAPDDLSSAEIGYIYNNRHVSKKLTISLIR